MARPNKAAVARQQKDAKQKKLLFVLVPVFLLLVVWQGPKMLKAFSGPQTQATPPPAQTTPVASAPGATPPTTPAPGAPPPAAPGTGLPDTDVPPAGGTRRLVSFSRFQSRDPFGRPSSSPAPDASAPADEGGAPDEAGDTAVIDVNGTSETVSVSAEFPDGQPTFRLVSVTEDGAVIGLVSGSFEGPEETVALAVGEQVELVADPDGARYTVTLVSIG